MQVGRLATWTPILIVVLGCGHGSARDTDAASASAETGADAEEANVFRSERYQYRWKLPPDWQFVTLEDLGLPVGHPGFETIGAARLSEDDAATALFVSVTDLVRVIPGWEPPPRPDRFQDMERAASAWLEREDLRITGVHNVHFLGERTIRVDGYGKGDEGEDIYTSIVILDAKRRRFIFQCTASEHLPGFACDDALRDFSIFDMPEILQPGDERRVLHLRSETFKLEFDPPDESWLGIGPRTGLGGHMSVWSWTRENRQVDVGVTDLAAAGSAVDETTFTKRMAERNRESGDKVTVKMSQLSGLPCTHLEIQPVQGHQRDVFVQKRGNLLYVVLVTVPVRDQALLDRVRAGVRITAPD
jgi:hypothetical protein